MDFCGEITNENCTEYRPVPQPGHIINAYVIPPLSIVGLIANVGCFIVLQRDRERKEACLLLQMLAIADFLYLLGSFFRYFMADLLHNRQEVTLRLFIVPTHIALQAATVWMMVLVTVDRYIYVCHPLHAKIFFHPKRRRLLALSVFVAASFYCIPYAFVACRRRIVEPCGTHDVLGAKNHQLSTTLQLVHTILIYAVPLTVLLLVNIRLIIAIRNSRLSVHRELTRHNQQRSENNATLVLIVIVIAFILCETPELIRRLLSEAGYWNLTVTTLGALSPLLMAINSSINFFIYIICGQRFRNILKEACRLNFSSSVTHRTRETLPLHPRLPATTPPDQLITSEKPGRL